MKIYNEITKNFSRNSTTITNPNNVLNATEQSRFNTKIFFKSQEILFSFNPQVASRIQIAVYIEYWYDTFISYYLSHFNNNMTHIFKKVNLQYQWLKAFCKSRETLFSKFFRQILIRLNLIFFYVFCALSLSFGK